MLNTTSEVRRIPPHQSEAFTTSGDLLSWPGRQFEQCGDIFKASIFGTGVYVVRDPAYAEHVLRKNWQNYVKGQHIKRVAFLLGNGLMASEGALWKQQRRMIQPAFHREVIARMMEVIVEINVALLDKWERAAYVHAAVDVTGDISHAILKIVLLTIFGADYDEVAPHFDLVSMEPERNLEFANAFRSLREIIRRVASRRRSEKSAQMDLLGMLMEARDRDTGRPMGDGQLANEVKTLIVAGHETTASTLNWIWYLLSQHSDVEEKLSAELDRLMLGHFPSMNDFSQFSYTRQIIEEALRLYPAGWLLTRKALKNDSLGPYFVPAGTEIYIPVYFIQRHPDFWPNPDHFQPERFSPEAPPRHALAMIPFSAGPRNCIGENLARVEMQTNLMMIGRRLNLRHTEAASPELDIGVNLRSRHNFFMTPTLKAVSEQPLLSH